jgi:hypothetical protein
MDISKDHQGNDVFLLSCHDATPVMIQPQREAETYNLLLQPEVREWLEQVPGAYKLRETPDFIEITFTDALAATAFKVRWYGSYPIVVIYAGDVAASEHSVMTPWNNHEAFVAMGRSAVISLLDDTFDSVLDVHWGEKADVRQDILIISDDRPVRLADIMADRLVKSLTISESPYTEKGFFRQFEERRRDGSFKKRRRK